MTFPCFVRGECDKEGWNHHQGHDQEYRSQSGWQQRPEDPQGDTTDTNTSRLDPTSPHAQHAQHSTGRSEDPSQADARRHLRARPFFDHILIYAFPLDKAKDLPGLLEKYAVPQENIGK